MIDPVRRGPDRDVMAVFANVAGRYVVKGFSGCVSTVVATHTVTRDRCMIEIRRYPANGRVTAVAIVTARNVRWIFADRD